MLFGIRWGSLRTKIIAWSFVPTMIILGVVAVVIFYAYQQVTEDLVIERNQELTRLTAGQFTAELKEYADLLDTEARTSDIYGNDPVAQRDALKGASNRLAVFDGGVLILDTFGTVVAAEPERPEILGQNWSDRTYYRQMLRSQILGSPGLVFSDIVADGPDGAEVIVIAVPIIGPQGEFVGTLAGTFRVGATTVSALYGDIVKLRIGESGSAYLVDGNGRVIYHTDTDLIADDVSAQAVVQQVLSGGMEAIRTSDFEGREIVASFAPVPGTSWGLVTQENWAALVHASRGYGQFLLLLLALGVLVPVLVVTVGVRRITRPIVELIGAAQEVAKGNFGQTITARTGDEIEELAEQFNLMSAQLQESYAHLEQRVAERTKELATLNTVAQTVSRSLELEAMLTATLDKALEALEFESGAIYLKDLKTSELFMACHRGLSDTFRRVVAKGIISARTAESGNPIIIDDLLKEPGAPKEVVEEGYRSVASIPLLSKGQLHGVLTTASRQLRRFRQEDVDLLLSIGNQIGVAIENARLFEAEERRAEQFRVISEVGRRMTSILAADELLWEIARLIKETLGYYLVGIALVEGDELIFRAGAGAVWETPRFQPPRLKVGQEGITGWVAQSGEPLLVPDVSQEPRYFSVPQASEIRSELAVPLKTKEAVIGVLHVQSDHLNAFDESDLAVLQSLANQAAIAIENARLYEQAQELAVVKERSRLARDLHDAVTQTLFSASLIAEVLPRLWERNPDEGRHRLEELRELTRGALAEMRTLLLELRPAALADAELGDLLRQLAESITGRARVPVTVTVEGQRPLPSEVKVALYRIAHEALNNVAKHAGASQATVNLRCTPPAPPEIGGKQRGGVELHVSDDGRGFDPEGISPESLGLGIMRERAEAIGATLTVESEIGRGTEVMVVWMDAQEDAEDG